MSDETDIVEWLQRLETNYREWAQFPKAARLAEAAAEIARLRVELAAARAALPLPQEAGDE